MEKIALEGLAESGGVVATGGGVVLDAKNRSTLSATGRVVWLEASPRVLAERLEGAEGRPLLMIPDAGRESVLATHLRERSALYEEVASHRISTEPITVAEVAQRIEEIWNA
jgi:shikimate kinase